VVELSAHFLEPALMTSFSLQGDHITLAQAVKAVGLAGSGGQAKHLVRSGLVLVNGVVEKQPGRKLYPGDRFSSGSEAEWVVGR
jgi:ribosome-associated protein